MEDSPINTFEIGKIKVSANKKLVCDRVVQTERVHMIHVAVQCYSTDHPISAECEKISLRFEKKLKPKRAWEEVLGVYIHGSSTQTGEGEKKNKNKSTQTQEVRRSRKRVYR